MLHRTVLELPGTILKRGCEREVESLIWDGFSAGERAMSGIGYRQMISQIAGEIDSDETVRLTAVATNRLIRHQNNWFKRDDPRIQWFDTTGDTGNQVNSIVRAAKAWRSSGG